MEDNTREHEVQSKKKKEYEIHSNLKKYKVKFIKGNNEIIFQATEIGDVKGTLYIKQVKFSEFERVDKYFRQFDDINEIFSDLLNRDTNKIKLEEIDNNIKLILQYEIRGKKKDIYFILALEKADINKIIMNLCEKSKEIDYLKAENERLKKQIAELQFYTRFIFKFFNQKNSNIGHQMPKIKFENWMLDSQKNDWKTIELSDKYCDAKLCIIF